jgi:localization factor PodJL
MLHTEDKWSAPQGEFGPYKTAGLSGQQLHDLAREIEDTQRRQSDTIASIVERMRALDVRRPEEPVTAPRQAQRADAGDEPWDRDTAEALMRSYESDQALRPLPPASSTIAGPENDWIGERISDVTQRIKRTLADLKPGSTVTLLEERLDEFQRHIASALEDVVRRADIAGLRIIEAHVTDLGDKLSQLERHVARLDGIESDVRAVMDQVSDDRIAKLLDYDSRFAADLEAVAMRAAEEVHARFGRDERQADPESVRRHEELRALIEASIQDRRNADAEAASFVTGLSGRVNAQSDRYDEIRGLLEQAIQEQRQSEKTAVTMLDTLQQALVQVLDRMDALEQQQAAAPAWPAAGAPAAFHSSASAGSDAYPDYSPAPATGFGGFGEIEQAAPVEIPSAFAEPAPSESAHDAGSPVDRMRRDFIADARRAKMKAAANRAEAVTDKGETSKRSVLDPTRAALAQAARLPINAGAGRLFGASPKLLAAALAVVVAINGGILVLNRKSPPPAPQIVVPSAAPEQSAPGQGSEAPEAQPQEKQHSDLGGTPGFADDGTEDGASSATAAAEAPDHEPADGVLTPYGLQDDVLSPVAVETIDADTPATPPNGMTVARPAGSLPNEVVADVYQQQVLASLSAKLGTIAATKTPDALLPEKSGRVESAYTPPDAGIVPDDGGERSSALDLPPATVGPLSLRLAAANGDASAEFEVAARLAEGKGTGQNFAEALRWYQRSATKGFAQSQYRLGTLYERGLGVTKDIGRAKVWYSRAAEQGNVKSMHNLAVLSAGGEHDEPDYSGAMQWFSKAAEHGLADSQYNLGVLLENGLGTKADRIAAYKWYALAAKGGDTDATARRDALKASFGAEDMKRAEALAAAFKPKPSIPLANDARAAGEDWKKRVNNDTSR